MVKKEYLFASIVFGIVIVDQVSKWWARSLEESIILIKGFFQILYLNNTGAAFGILQGQNVALIVASFLILGVFFYFREDFLQTRMTTSLAACVTGGALGNLTDRIFLGAVVDFIDFSFWPTFNIADSAISIGVLGLLSIYLFAKDAN